ncbi:MAG TPA: hypothetical protein VIZ00_01135, partial [Streptosporangiaceae bacterium]
MRPGQEQSRFGSGLPGDADEAAGEDRPPGPAVEPGRPPLPARRPRPERSAGAERPAGPEPPSARPTIQQPPPRRIQHPLPAS